MTPTGKTPPPSPPARRGFAAPDSEGTVAEAPAGRPSSLGIANGGDDVGILTPESTATAFTFVDGSNHGTVMTFFPDAVTLGANQSYERVPADTDTDSASDWVLRTSGNATPGAVTVPEPAGLGLLAAGAAAVDELALP